MAWSMTRFTCVVSCWRLVGMVIMLQHQEDKLHGFSDQRCDRRRGGAPDLGLYWPACRPPPHPGLRVAHVTGYWLVCAQRHCAADLSRRAVLDDKRSGGDGPRVYCLGRGVARNGAIP